MKLTNIISNFCKLADVPTDTLVSELLQDNSLANFVLLSEDEPVVELKEYKIYVSWLPMDGNTICKITSNKNLAKDPLSVFKEYKLLQELGPKSIVTNKVYDDFTGEFFYVLIVRPDILEYYKLLTEAGIKFLPAGGTFFLGIGDNQAAFRIIYKGKEAVAKISSSWENTQNMLKLNQIKSSLGELGKHIMNVYDMFKLQGNDIYYVTIVEPLLPIPSIIKNTLFTKKDQNLTPYEQKIKESPLDNLDQLKAIISGLTKKYVLKIDYPGLISEFEESLAYELWTWFKTNNSIGQNDIKKMSYQIFKDVSYQVLGREISTGLSVFSDRLWSTLDLLFSGRIFPAFGTPPEPAHLKSNTAVVYPEVESLIKLLQILKDKYGIIWQDMHGENIMQRKDGTLVISDPGEFKLTS